MSARSSSQKTNSRNRNNRLILPLTITLIGLGAVTAAVLLIARELKNLAEDGEQEVENYEVVRNKPFIFSRLWEGSF